MHVSRQRDENRLKGLREREGLSISGIKTTLVRECGIETIPATDNGDHEASSAILEWPRRNPAVTQDDFALIHYKR